MSKLEQVKKVIEIGFAGKGLEEHWRARNANDDKDALMARAGLGTDAIGGAQMIGEFALEKGKNISTGFGSYSGVGKMRGIGTPIIGAALLAINGMQLACGVEDPETGDRFASGARNFTAIADGLKQLTPTDQWYGSGSESYTDQNEQQQERAATMSKVDNSVKEIIANEAKQIQNTRKILEISAMTLTICIPIAIVIGKIPPTGPANQMAFEIGAVAGAMPFAQTATTTMFGLAMQNGLKLAQAAGAYREVAAGAKPSGAPPASMSPPGGNTTSKPWSPSGGSATGTGTGSIDV
ncbi:EspA/EspE family type VII secretion system effector [Mycolicibacterium sp. 050232]|uniref:EspA/EspE family type VII secretion system effector n=1 Tax=Mycolicibacterium sp. 050232 TaxID=3113982 RepID=UPI002E28A586|nr:EspA/EspE family type VII secretion system effector [Mycolicibacterium sp. 050232]MED5815673.1 EspA/EspE family type VII secretion system effector [Mycolicibacterium sp. 050232]